MSNKSATSEQVISLPKGGGVMHGISEKFSPDLHTGTGNFTVPITLPSGHNGIQPQLTLVYSIGNGNSPFGLGWSLSIPGVSRYATWRSCSACGVSPKKAVSCGALRWKMHTRVSGTVLPI